MDNFQTYALFLETIPDAAIIIDSSSIIQLSNKNAARMFGYPTSDLLQQPLDILLPLPRRQSHHQQVSNFFEHPAQRKMGQDLVLTGQRSSGEIFAIDIMISKIRLDEKDYAVAIIRDDSKRQNAEEQIRLELEKQRHHAQTDSLTGLPNRRAFSTALDNHLTQLEYHNIAFSLAYLDLDNFKEVNDTEGHQIGDLLLQKFGHFLNQLCRSRDLIARIGGDEFAIILAESNEKQTLIALQRICDQVVKLFTREKWPVTVSVGWVYCSERGQIGASSDLMMAADKAMYQAKQQGKNNIARGYY
ncbi:sensor domain-containing diguanylate cyclase [Aliidiomarina minuta]|nr:sensor domain-containing diguanylate cyclase [Aliidiomarina minuta]